MQLFPHQVAGVDWLVRPEHARAGLFDDMGLGKTATAICAADRVGGRLLVCAPAVAVWNWRREIETWAPGRRVQVITESSDVIRADADAVVVTHGMLIRPTLAAQLFVREWDVTVLDEAHHFRNRGAKRTRAFYGGFGRRGTPSVVARSKRVWLLTGTPMPNNPSELWPMLVSLAPERITLAQGGPPMNWYQFRGRYCVVRPDRYKPEGKVVGVQNGAELRERMKGFALRRRLRDHLSLPPLRWGRYTLAIDAEAKRKLEAALEPKLRKLIETASPEDVLEALKANADFSRYRHLCGLAKVRPVVEMIDEELNSGLDCIVLFAHHTDVIDGLVHGFREFGWSAEALTGDVSTSDRQKLVDRFQSGSLKILVCQLTAGGVAITLTRASNVGFVEQSFVPGDNAQCVGRIERIGQTQPMLARMFSLAGSVDELLVDILSRKIAMIREVLR